MTWIWKIWAGLATLLMVFVLGTGLGWRLRQPKQQAPEKPAAEVRQPDGSLILKRPAQDPTAKPAQQIPTGAVVERIDQVIVRPSAPVPGTSAEETAPTIGSLPEAGLPLPLPLVTPCPDLRVDLTLIRLGDQSQRVIASSPDGTVVGGVDIPVSSSEPPSSPELKWSAGVAFSPFKRTWGLWATRAVGPFAVGVGVEQVRPALTGSATYDGRVTVGLRF
jgi:hypothetical protein